MKTAILMRHGEDINGTLVDLGKKQIENTAEKLIKAKREDGEVIPNHILILHSTALRAKQSCDIVVGVFEGAGRQVTVRPSKLLCDEFTDIPSVLQNVEEDYDTVMAISHRPPIRQALYDLIGDDLKLECANAVVIKTRNMDDTWRSTSRSTSSNPSFYLAEWLAPSLR